MVTKIVGYVLSLAGLLGLALTIEPIAKLIPLKIPEQMSTLPINIISGVLIVIGLVLVIKTGKGSSRQAPEVPIYHGKNIVGYRRH